MKLTGCALLLIAIHVAAAICCPEPLAAMAVVDVPFLFLCRYLLRRRDDGIGGGGGGGRLQFRLKAAVLVLYMVMSALFFLRFAPITPWWGAVAAWAIMLLLLEVIFAFFFFPYSYCNELGWDVENPGGILP